MKNDIKFVSVWDGMGNRGRIIYVWYLCEIYFLRKEIAGEVSFIGDIIKWLLGNLI